MKSVPSDEHQEIYRRAFVQSCLLLIVRAHERLDTNSLRSSEEPHITGLLVNGARELLEAENAEPAFEHLEVMDDPPQNDIADRVGKARPRIDIEFVRTGRGTRPRFHVEAKRLYRSDSVNEYFGLGGLGMFLNGSYASRWPSAGMIGYVQNENRATWFIRLLHGFGARKNSLDTCIEQADLRPAAWSNLELAEVQESCHQRTPATLGKIRIYHLLLEFV